MLRWYQVYPDYDTFDIHIAILVHLDISYGILKKNINVLFVLKYLWKSINLLGFIMTCCNLLFLVYILFS